MNNKDITALLNSLKVNIKRIEGGEINSSILDEVRSDFLDMLELINLFLISERDSYYGYFLMNLQFDVNFQVNSIAGIKLNTFPPVFESNPLLLCKFTLKEIIYVICHEIDHIVLNHPAEMVKANPDGDEQTFYEFNLAADASVNDRINHEIEAENHLFMSPPDGLITSQSLLNMLGLQYIRPMENYAYYFNLISQNGGASSSQQNGQSSVMQKQNEKDGTESDVGNGETGDSGEVGEIVTAANCGELSDHNWEAGEDADDAAAAVREFVNSVYGTMNEETRGLMPASFISEIEKINRPPVISWQSVLKKYVGTITANKRKTKMRLNRRQPERFDLSGSVDDKVLKIAVAIDTSASVDNGMIAEIFNEIFSILAKRKHEITVIECDSAVQRVYKARNAGDIKMKVKGRGGTMFSPVIEYINDNKYFRDALLIYFTDGYGESEIPRPKTYRNMWVVIGNKRHLSLDEPYGAVMSL